MGLIYSYIYIHMSIISNTNNTHFQLNLGILDHTFLSLYIYIYIWKAPSYIRKVSKFKVGFIKTEIFFGILHTHSREFSISPSTSETHRFV